MKAELYALTHRGNAGDIAFYREVCRDARSVLELGSGYGRILSALASARRKLVGLEFDPEFVRLARRNLRKLPASKQQSVRLVRADMRDFSLEQRFERVLLPYNALFCLLTKRDALSCFRAARRALEPGGTFALDVWNAEPFHGSGPDGVGEDDATPIASIAHAERTWDVFEQSRVRRTQQRLDVSYTYLPREGGTPYQIPIAQRYFLASEIADLLQRAGFAIAARYGDFSKRRYGARSAQLIVIARAI